MTYRVTVRSFLYPGVRALALLAALSAGACSAESAAPAPQTTPKAATTTAATTDAPGPRARIETTLGPIAIEFFSKEAPVTSAHILKLIDDGFYNGLIFHRVIAGFVIQGGGYTKDMTLREPPGTVVNESINGLSNRKGTLAMARLQDPDSADSQWFINVVDNTRLDAKRTQAGYTVFAQVIDGWDTITAIELTNTIRRDGMAGVPESPIEILSIERF